MYVHMSLCLMEYQGTPVFYTFLVDFCTGIDSLLPFATKHKSCCYLCHNKYKYQKCIYLYAYFSSEYICIVCIVSQVTKKGQKCRKTVCE